MIIDCISEKRGKLINWIPVSEKYPPNDMDEVIVYGQLCDYQDNVDDYDVHYASYYYSYFEGHEFNDLSDCGFPILNVTHWMPKPSPPEIR